MTEKTSLTEAPATGIRHEATAINGRMAGLCGLSVFAIVALGLLASGELRRWLSPPRSAPATVVQAIARSTDVPTINPQQKKTRSHYEAEQRERLSTYGWVDPSKGRVHIPIDRAIEILVQKNRRDQ